MDQVWKGLSNLDPCDPGGFYKKPPLSGQGIGHSRWWSSGVPVDRNSENAFPEGIF